MRLLHVGVHDGDGWILEDESQSDPGGAGARHLGNLCRCQDYDKILTAMMRGAENTEEGLSMLKNVGQDR